MSGKGRNHYLTEYQEIYAEGDLDAHEFVAHKARSNVEKRDAIKEAKNKLLEYESRGIPLEECPDCSLYGERDSDCETCSGLGIAPIFSFCEDEED